MAFSLKEIKQQNARPQELRTTLIQVTGYQLEGDPKNHRILGLDLEDLDEKGVPKAVKVAIEPFSERQGNRNTNTAIPKPKEFAEWVNAKTEVGGTILISRAFERNGELVADYAQRISPDNQWVRKGNNGVDYSIGCQRGYIKVLPDIDQATGQLKVSGGGSRPEYHTGRASFFPDAVEEKTVNGGPDFEQEFRAALHHAIDSVPDTRMQPQLILFMEAEGSHEHFFIRNQKKDEQSNRYITLTKDEMKAELDENPKVKQYMDACSSPDAQGVVFRTRSGFGLSMVDSRDINNEATNAMRQVGRNDVIYNKTRIERLAPETLQQFRLPPHMKTPERSRDIKNRPVFVHGYISYEIPSAPNQRPSLQKIAKTMDKNYDQKNSLNGGFTVMDNPHWEKDDQGMFIYPDQENQQAPAPQQAAANQQPAPNHAQPAPQQQNNYQAAMAAQAPQGHPAAQQAAPQQPAHQPQGGGYTPSAPQHHNGGYQQPAAAQGYSQPEPMPEPPMPDDEAMDHFIDNQVDFDMEDLETELGQAPGI